MIELLHGLRRLRKSLRLQRPQSGSLAVRVVDAGSCNGCEHELNAACGPHYDMQRLGLNIVASPRHADVLLVTGSVTSAMVEPLRRAYAAMPEPRLVVALGDCSAGVGVMGSPHHRGTGVADVLPVDLHVAGCPTTPDQILDGLTRCRRGGV